MNMKKLLATGLIASVAFATAESSASCGNGGFYVGANFGVAFTKAKATNEKYEYGPEDQGNKYGGEDSGWEIQASDDDNTHKYIPKDIADKRSELTESAMVSKKTKTKVLAELVIGYDFRLNDVMMGVELNAGGIFGSNNFKSKEVATKNADAAQYDFLAGDKTFKPKVYAKIKEQWHIALMPRVGYLFTPQFEGYVTFGVKLAKYRTEVDTLLITEVLDHQGDISPTSATLKKKSTKAVFVAGAGVRYEFNPSMFAKLEYNFEFGAKPKLHSEAMPELQKIKVTSHTIKLGLGYRF